MGWICPIWPSARFATKLAPMCKKPCCFAVPLIKGRKIADFLKNIFFSFLTDFFKFLVIFCRFLAVGHILRLACFLAALAAPGWQNSTWVPRKTHTSKNWPIFPICMWKRVGSAPSGQARVSRPNWPQCAKSHAAWQSLSSRAEKLRIFSKIFFFHFLTNFFRFGDF